MKLSLLSEDARTSASWLGGFKGHAYFEKMHKIMYDILHDPDLGPYIRLLEDPRHVDVMASRWTHYFIGPVMPEGQHPTDPADDWEDEFSTGDDLPILEVSVNMNRQDVALQWLPVEEFEKPTMEPRRESREDIQDPDKADQRIREIINQQIAPLKAGINPYAGWTTV